MNVIIQPVISLFDELSYRLLGWQKFTKEERIDLELKTTSDLVQLIAHYDYILAYLYLTPKGLI